MPVVDREVLLTNEDLRYIESVIYEPAAQKRELTLRKIVKANTNYPRHAKEIGYDWYKRTGKAKIMAAGARPHDVGFVGEKGGRIVHKCYDILQGIEYS